MFEVQTGEEMTLDEKIIACIDAGCAWFSEIYAKLELDPRTIDRRLQALRKKGVLAFDNKRGWSLTETK